jgi:eukaryotic-like serine/threonine-protein kinase
MSLSSGTVFGQYRIGRRLGAGGMGEVYQATHLVLGREVALKTLHPEAGESQLSSLIREARAVSALDHPNIVKVYDVAEVDGTVYIAMEYIEGQTLRQVLAQRALRTKEAIQFAVQIARALAAAHDVGILHRDVKPANIMVTRRNVVKVVDFGLARRFDPPAPSDPREHQTADDAPTRSMQTGMLTGQIRIEGTVGYMSPEQISGPRVDARSDIFSFGIVLYEMLTRARPFSAPSDIGITANILHADPRPAREVVTDLPEELDDLLRFCLNKDPEERARSAHDVAHMLEAAGQAIDRRSPVSDTGGNRRRWLVAGGVGLLAIATALVAGAFIVSRRGKVETRPVLRRITWDDGLAEWPALSDDGRLLAFASDRAEGSRNLDIFVRHMSGGEPVRLTSNPADDTQPSFSPDGGSIAFRSERQGGGVYVIPSLGGQERLVVPLGNNPRFSPDGKWIAYWVGESTNMTPSARSYILPVTGGVPRQLQPSFADARFPIWTPDGTHILFEGVDVWKSDTDPDRDWWVTPIDGGKAVKTGAWSAIARSGIDIYPPGGWYRNSVVFSGRDEGARSVLDIPVSTRTWRATGPAEALTFGTGIDGYPYPAPGGEIAFTSYQYEINIWSRSLDESGRLKNKDKEARKLTAGAAYHSSASMNTAGARLVFLLGRNPSRNVWIRDLATGRESALAVDGADKCSAAISPDGLRAAWSVCGPGPEAVYVAGINADLSVPVAEKVCDDCGRVVDWSRAGDSILFVDHSKPVRVGVLTLSSKERMTISSARYNLNTARFSPDGKWIALTAVARGDRAQIFAIPLADGKPAPEPEWVAITNGDAWDYNPVWAERGDALLFYSRRDGFGCFWRQAVNPATKRPEGPATELLEFHNGRLSLKELSGLLPSVSVVNNQILYNALERTGSIWVRDDVRASASEPRP